MAIQRSASEFCLLQHLILINVCCLEKAPQQNYIVQMEEVHHWLPSLDCNIHFTSRLPATQKF